MMEYFWLVMATVTSAAISVFGGFYNRQRAERGSGSLYSLLLVLGALVSWLILFLTEPDFAPGVLVYSLFFGVFYVMCNIGLISALKCGSVSLTNLFLQLALIVTTVWGLIFWGAEMSVAVIVGILLVVVSLVMCLYQRGDGRFSFKWLILALMAMGGNAGCAITVKEQQMAFDGAYGSMMMVFALSIAAVFALIYYLRDRAEHPLTLIKKSGWLPMLAGVVNMLANLFVMWLTTSSLSPSLIYPTMGVAGIALVILASLFFFKERLRPMQWAGIAVGAAAVLVLSI